jgi:hypothetical protein
MNDLSKTKDEYESIKLQIKRFPSLNEPSKPLKKICELIFSFNEYQIELETTLEPVFQMCQLIKSKGKKIIREDSKEDIRDMLGYVNLLLKPDFFSLLFDIYNKDDLVYAIMHLQSQKSLFNELKKQEPYKSGLMSISLVKEDDLKKLINKWQDLYTEIEKYKKSSEFLDAYDQFINSLTIPIDDLKFLSEKLREYHRAVLHYHLTNTKFKRFRYNVFKFCIEEFNERVELIWPN